MVGKISFAKKDSLTKRIEKAKEGNMEEREQLIQDYMPFIIKTISNKTNKYMESENSDELSIGMNAFNEALDKYEFSKGGFINYAKLVIESRIIDFMRISNKSKKVVLFSQIEEEDNITQKYLSTGDFTESIPLKSEINELETELKKFKITFNDLVEQSPKHIDTRKKAIDIARYIVSNKKLKQMVFDRKKIPITLVANQLNITPKVIRKSKKFIIATVIILDSNLELIKSYVPCIKGGVVDDI